MTLRNMSLITVFVIFLCLLQNVSCSVATYVSIYITPYVNTMGRSVCDPPPARCCANLHVGC